MTNSDFVSNLKESQSVRNEGAINHIRQALRNNGVDTSDPRSNIDPHSAAVLVYATILSPSSRKSAAEWIDETLKRFHRKKVLKEVTPIDILRELFEDQKKANDLARVVIDLATGDLYAIDLKDERSGRAAYFLPEKLAKKRPTPMIQHLAQISGDYFRFYHEFRSKLN